MPRFKPGDVVQVVRPNRACDEPYRGCVLVLDEFDGELWFTDPELPSLDPEVAGGDWIVGWYEEELRLLRDPGDDAVDEMVALLRTPQEVTS
jgi:hypothetical protein